MLSLQQLKCTVCGAEDLKHIGVDSDILQCEYCHSKFILSGTNKLEPEQNSPHNENSVLVGEGYKEYLENSKGFEKDSPPEATLYTRNVGKALSNTITLLGIVGIVAFALWLTGALQFGDFLTTMLVQLGFWFLPLYLLTYYSQKSGWYIYQGDEYEQVEPPNETEKPEAESDSEDEVN